MLKFDPFLCPRLRKYHTGSKNFPYLTIDDYTAPIYKKPSPVHSLRLADVVMRTSHTRYEYVPGTRYVLSVQQ